MIIEVQRSQRCESDANLLQEVVCAGDNVYFGWMYRICRDSLSFEFSLNNTNLTFLAFLYKIDIEGFQNQQK